VKANLLTLPPALTKNKREHVLPLTPLALKILPTSSNECYVLPGRRNTAFNRWSKAKTALDRLSARDLQI
jgi:hypothetical protein